MIRRLQLTFASLYSPRMTGCGVSDGRLKPSLTKTFNMNAVKENMYRSFFQSFTKRAKDSICYSKSTYFFNEKKYVVKNFIL